jgi:hypothetical protein
MDQHDVSSIEVVAGLTPFQLFVKSSGEAQMAKRSEFRAPPLFTGVDFADEWFHVASTSGLGGKALSGSGATSVLLIPGFRRRGEVR